MVGAMRTAVITGASSGIGAATARALAGEDYRTVLGARRLDRLEALAAEIGGEAIALDVADPASVAAFADRIESCDVLVNNAGGALGLESIGEADEEKWRQMYEANVLGTMRMSRALLPRLIDSGDGQIVGVTSIAAFEAYRGGAGYMAAKHAQRAMLRALRLARLRRNATAQRRGRRRVHPLGAGAAVPRQRRRDRRPPPRPGRRNRGAPARAVTLQKQRPDFRRGLRSTSQAGV
jgi:NADP-dependent 3-hydroxy acid dehydrogenase YdfG